MASSAARMPTRLNTSRWWAIARIRSVMKRLHAGEPCGEIYMYTVRVCRDRIDPPPLRRQAELGREWQAQAADQAFGGEDHLAFAVEFPRQAALDQARAEAAAQGFGHWRTAAFAPFKLDRRPIGRLVHPPVDADPADAVGEGAVLDRIGGQF